MFELYRINNKETDDKFIERTKVTKATDPISMLKHLGVNKKYIIMDTFKFSNSDSKLKYEFKNKLPDNSVELSNVSESEDDFSTPRPRDKTLNDELLPYHESIKALERIENFTSPREKLD